MSCSIPLLFLLTALSLASLVTPAFSGGIAIYRGEYGDEPTVESICASHDYKFPYVVIGYLSQFGDGRTPILSIANNYPDIGKDIKSCRDHGVKVLLSIGGNEGSYSLNGSLDANSVADYLWDNFLSENALTGPLGAILDGIDFDISQGPTGYYDDLALDLAKKREFREVDLSAAPNCSYPDRYVGTALDTGRFDAVWPKFYDNPSCEYDDSGDTSKLIKSWDTWTKVNAREIFLGVTAHPRTKGYIPPDVLISQILPVIQQSDKYGGVMVSAGSPEEKKDYINKIFPNV